MLGSRNNFFRQPKQILEIKRIDVYNLLKAKGYTDLQIEIYMQAYDYFCNNINEYDGATIVKDLIDIPGLDLDAMLHDFHYLKYSAATNFITKWKADWIYAKGQERKGKGQYSSFSRFVGLTIIGVLFVPYAYWKRGKIRNYQEITINIHFSILIK